VTGNESNDGDAERAEAAYLLTTEAVRARAEEMYRLGLEGALRHFTIDESKLGYVVDRVVEVTREAYPDLKSIPYHARYRHFGVGGIDRLARFDSLLASRSEEDRLCARVELVVTSVLLDAGAGPGWSYRDASGTAHARSEGLAVASYELFEGGEFSDDRMDGLRADAGGLLRFTARDLEKAFQVSPDNPLVGAEGRASVLQKLGAVVLAKPAYFGTASPRLGRLGTYLASRAVGGALPARVVLDGVLDALGDIWPGRETCAGKNLGDVWHHPDVGRVPFHKLSQWLSYSLAEPLEQAGVRVVALDELTGLAEYRNGGLFIDAGVLVPRQASVLADAHLVSSTEVVEWRALTVALLDRTAAEMRRRLGLSPEALPLAKVLEGGTWRAGRRLAAERRADGSPPLRVVSDGTVF
jgi:hypothetical protein